MELFAADGHDAGGCERVTGKSGMRPRKVAKHMDTRAWADHLAPTLKDEVAGKRPFEIDQFCEQYVETRIDDQLGDRVSICAYDLGLPRGAVLAVLRVELREELVRLTGQNN